MNVPHVMHRLSDSEVEGLLALEPDGKSSCQRDVPVASVLTASGTVRRWLAGREAVGCYLIRYATGDKRPWHVDVLQEGGAHSRLVVMLRDAYVGGHLYLGPSFAGMGRLVPLGRGDAVAFRADLVYHEVTEIRIGTRLVLSIGARG